MKTTTLFVALGCAGLMFACSERGDDIRIWMSEQEQTMRGRVEPLPTVMEYPTVAYADDGLVSPFDPGRIEPEQRAEVVKGGPDLTRPREPLESFPLESLKMMGVLTQGDEIAGLIRAGETLHQVRTGNHMGQDFGVITSIDETEITLIELVEDMNGDWVERTSTMFLHEQ